MGNFKNEQLGMGLGTRLYVSYSRLKYAIDITYRSGHKQHPGWSHFSSSMEGSWTEALT